MQDRIELFRRGRWLQIAAALSVLGSYAVAQIPGPSPRLGHSMAYDSLRGKVVLFGGNDTGQNALLRFQGDTWEWDGTTWSQMPTPVAPPPRAYSAMVFDASRGVCVLFGGASAAPFGDTWEWNGTTWAQRSTPTAPSTRFHHMMAYDPSRNRTVLYGGNTSTGHASETWEWDGSAWSAITTTNNPGSRIHHSMTFDAVNNEVLLVAGYSGAYTNDTWTFDGATWTQRVPVGPFTARGLSALSWQTHRNRAVLFGGWTGGQNLDDTWEWDGSIWSPVTTLRSPLARHYVEASTAYDSARGELMLFGGWNGGVIGDTWTFDGSDWMPELHYLRSPINGHEYAQAPSMTLDEAASVATVIGQQLATVRSPAEQAWIVSTFGTGQWIGLNDRAVEGSWAWASGEPVGFTNWCPGEPNGGAAENHVQISCNGTGWADIDGTLHAPALIERIGGPIDDVETAVLATILTPPQVTDHAIAPLPSSGALLFGGNTAAGTQSTTHTLLGTTWTQQFPLLNPTPRSEHALVLNPVSQTNILFGGKNPLGTPLSDTWIWSNGQWSLHQGSPPPARSGHRMACDTSRNTVLLFGGKNAAGTALGDFWSFDGISWSLRTPATLPPARFRHGMAFDATRNKTIVFGGTNGATRLSDAWEWDGTQWILASTAIHPSERHGPALAFDSARNTLVAFGGRDRIGFSADTWELRSSPSASPNLEWEEVQTANAPSVRNGVAFAFDSVRNRHVLFGGFDGQPNLGDTWEYTGTNWTAIAPPVSPPGRTAAAMVFDSARQCMVLFGGFRAPNGQRNDTWEWNGTTWTQIATSVSPSPRQFHAMSYDAARQRTVMFGGFGIGGFDLGDTYEYDGTNWTLVAASGPSPRQIAQICFDPVRNETVLFGGGTSNGSVDAETWTYNGIQWTQRSPLTSPPARWNAASAFDSSRGKVVLFAGATAGFATNFSDTWEWDGTNWQLAPLQSPVVAYGPGARDGHAMAYDPLSERVVVHGGENTASCQQDIWSYDSQGFTLHVPGSLPVPSPRSGSQLFFDSGSNRLLLFAGGCGQNAYTNDLWQLALPVSARHESYGSPCLGSNGALELRVLPPSRALVGQTFQLELANVPLFSPCLGFIGFSNTSFGGTPLPFSLTPLNMSGCFAYQSADLNFALAATNNATNTAAWPLAIPNDPIFLAMHIYLQALALEFGGARFATTTNGIEARIGNR